MLLGPDSGMEEYAGAEIVGTAGLPFPFYPELKFNFFRPLFMCSFTSFDQISFTLSILSFWATGLAAARFFNVPLVSSYHTNLAAYCEHFGFSLLTRPMWSYNRFVHSQCSLTFCPSPSTAAMLRLEGFEHLRICLVVLIRPSENQNAEVQYCEPPGLARRIARRQCYSTLDVYHGRKIYAYSYKHIKVWTIVIAIL